MYCLSSYLHIQGFLPQTASSAFAAYSPARITAEHIFILNLISVRLHPFEELVQTNDRIFFSLGRSSFPDNILDFLTEIAVRFEYRDAVSGRVAYQLILEPSHLVTSPAGNRSVVNSLAFVRNHQVLTDTYYLAETSTDRTSAQRAVETEKIFIRLGEFDTVSFKTIDEFLQYHRSIVEFFPYQNRPPALFKCCFH